MDLGSAATVSLADARRKAEALRRQLAEGIDPLAAKQDWLSHRWESCQMARTFGVATAATAKAQARASRRHAVHRGARRAALISPKAVSERSCRWQNVPHARWWFGGKPRFWKNNTAFLKF